nr:methionyl-tRNA formyltransferase [Oceanococcus sp. HetDA_MAG_MS8]
MRVVFAGTPEFAAAPLRALIAAGVNIVGVLTQPDRPAGRGRKLMPSPVRQVATDAGLPVATPVNFKSADNRAIVADWKPDLMVVIAYGLILPQAVLDIPRLGCVNVHASLLPRWRGAAPIQRAIAAGDASSGVCLMQMEAGLDTGPELARLELDIAADMTGGQLHDVLVERTCAALPQWLAQLEGGALQARPQPEQGVTYAHKLSKEEARLDLQRPASELARLVRAFDPWPVAYLSLGSERLRLFGAAKALAMTAPGEAGTLLPCCDSGALIACGEGALWVPEMQWPGRKRLPAAEALRSRKLVAGDRLHG